MADRKKATGISPREKIELDRSDVRSTNLMFIHDLDDVVREIELLNCRSR